MNKKKQKVSLFGDDDDVEAQEGNGLDINKGYAQNYDNWRRLEEMQKIKDKYGDVDDDSESSESEPEWTDEHEEAFLRTLGALKSGDRSCFADGKSFFNDIQVSEDGKSKKAKDSKKKQKKDEKMTIKDYERKLVLEKGGQIDESDEEAEIQKTHQKGYYEEQEEIRKSLANAIHFGDDDDDEDILTERKKTSKELEEEDADFYEWMKTADTKGDKKKAKELKHLKKFWKDDEQKLDDSEKFLRDYLMNKDYQPGENEENPTYDEIVALEEDEKELDKNRQYEHKYNFRFEDPDQEFIKQYPRTVAESMRTDDSSRKEKRHEREERKKREKDEKKKELAELKKMKRSEIEQKLGKLRKAAGIEIPLTMDDLNADFDPKEFDKKMKSIFNDEYYGVEENVQEDEDEKPVFSDMDDSDYEDYDNLDVEELKKEGAGAPEEEDSEESEGSDDDSEDEEAPKSKKSAMKNGKFDMVAAAQKAMSKDKNENRRKSKRNALKEALAKKKPLFNPKEKTFEEYFNEYYALDYEDIIGDTPTRFRYRDVEANDFGLSTGEILEADERQLNAWASLKKVTAYRTPQEEFFDRKAYQRKAEDSEKKKRILSTDFGGKKSLKRKAEEEEMMMQGEGAELVEEEEKKKKKKKRGKKKVKVVTQDPEAMEEAPEVVEVTEDVEKAPEAPKQAPKTLLKKKKAPGSLLKEKKAPESMKDPEEAPESMEDALPMNGGGQNGGGQNGGPPAKKKARKRNNKNKHNAIAEKFGEGMTDSRVKAYGLNPSRLKKGLFYGQ